MDMVRQAFGIQPQPLQFPVYQPHGYPPDAILSTSIPSTPVLSSPLYCYTGNSASHLHLAW